MKRLSHTAGVHDADLHVRMGRSIFGRFPAAFLPVIAMGATGEADFAAIQIGAFSRCGPDHDGAHDAIVLR
jgi:hypothetical protein